MRIRRGPATVTGDADRIQPLLRDAGGKARKVVPGARRPTSDRRHHEALAERGWLLSEVFSSIRRARRHRRGDRARGTGARRAGERDHAHRGDRRHAGPGRRTCARPTRPPAPRVRRARARAPSARCTRPRRATGPGRSSARAWDWFVESIKGEPHASDADGYWSLWINNRYADLGLCGTEVQEGDKILLAPRIELPILDLTAGARRRRPRGQPVTVDVHAYGVSSTRLPSTTPFDGPAEGATVTAAARPPGGRRRQGAAHLRDRPAAWPCRPPRPGTCAPPCARVDGARRRAGVPPPPAAGAGAGHDGAGRRVLLRRSPTARSSPARKAPRELSGTVSADPSGLRSVRLSIRRQKGGKCWTYRDTTERFKRHRCGGKWYFRIGDRAEWSYLLPRKLPRGATPSA